MNLRSSMKNKESNKSWRCFQENEPINLGQSCVNVVAHECESCSSNCPCTWTLSMQVERIESCKLPY